MTYLRRKTLIQKYTLNQTKSRHDSHTKNRCTFTWYIWSNIHIKLCDVLELIRVTKLDLSTCFRARSRRWLLKKNNRQVAVGQTMITPISRATSATSTGIPFTTTIVVLLPPLPLHLQHYPHNPYYYHNCNHHHLHHCKQKCTTTLYYHDYTVLLVLLLQILLLLLLLRHSYYFY